MNSASDSRHQPSDVRDGEIAVALPDRFDASLYFIGRIRTPWKAPEGLPEERPRGARDRRGLHHRARSALGAGAAGHRDAARTWSCSTGWTGRGATSWSRCRAIYGKGRGTFALRSPVRPNPIAHERGQAGQGRGQHGSRWSALDCLDGTPLLDIKPYFASTDSIPDAVTGA